MVQPVSSSEPDRLPDQNEDAARCTVLIVTYQSARHIDALLSALERERQSGVALDIVVIDNASSDATESIVIVRQDVTFICAGGNLGYSAGINLGLRRAPSGVPVLILNPDTVPEPGAIAMLLAESRVAGVGVVVPRIQDCTGMVSPSLRNEPSLMRAFTDAVFGGRAAMFPAAASQMIWGDEPYQAACDVDWATGAALLVAPDCWETVGEWDERFFLYSEETDYFRRVRSKGFRVCYVPGAVVTHEGGGSGTSDGLYALMTVNAVRYFAKYHSRSAVLVFAAITLMNQALRCHRSAARLAMRALIFERTRARSLPRPVVER